MAAFSWSVRWYRATMPSAMFFLSLLAFLDSFRMADILAALVPAMTSVETTPRRPKKVASCLVTLERHSSPFASSTLSSAMKRQKKKNNIYNNTCSH